MRGFQFRPVPDADRHVRLVREQLHELQLTVGVECRGCLVQDNDIWFVQEDAGKGDTLFFAS
jgi:hypothetical protein